MAVVHTSLAEGRWQTFTLAEQLGNIGSEVGRAINWREQGNATQWQRAFDRALELFDLTIADSRWKMRLREILRAREVACDFFYGGNQYRSTSGQLDFYFMSFGILARRDR